MTKLFENFFDLNSAISVIAEYNLTKRIDSIEREILQEAIEEALQKINKLRQGYSLKHTYKETQSIPTNLAQIREEEYQKAYLEGESDRMSHTKPTFEEPLKLTGPMVSIPTTFFSKDHSDDLDEGNH